MKTHTKLVIYICLLGLFNPVVLHAERVGDDQLQAIVKGVNRAAKQQQINPYMLLAVIRAESNFDRYAKSGAGARGLMQLMPMTQKELGVNDVFDVQQNINGGACYLVQQIKYYKDVRKALWAYNTGPGNVNRGIIPNETHVYANQVIHFYKQYKSRGQQ